MFVRDMSVDQFKVVDPNNWATSYLILDYLSIVGTATESEIEEYLQFYSILTQMYRIASISYLLEMGFITYSAEGYTLTGGGL
jgi:hypothetical protein